MDNNARVQNRSGEVQEAIARMQHVPTIGKLQRLGLGPG